MQESDTLPPSPASSETPTTSVAPPKGARAVCSIDVDAIAVPPERLRKFRPEVVDWLVESITARNVLQSISVRRRGAGYELVAGLHRLEAARKCGHQVIRAEVYDDLGDDEAKLLQIDENLCRAELSPAERAAHLVERKRLYETLHPETSHGGDRRSAEVRSSSQLENLKNFVEDTAAKTGKGRSTIAREAKRGADIRDVAQLAGTSLDSGAELDTMAYPNLEDTRAALIANRIDPDVLERAMMPPFPTPKPLPKPGRCSDPRSALARAGIRDHLHATMA